MSQRLETENKSEQKISNNDENTGHIYCNTIELYNAVLFPQQKLFIDIRSQKQYNESHTKHFINIPINSDQNSIDKIIEQSIKHNNNISHTFAINIYCYSDKNSMINELDKKFYKVIEQSISNVCTAENESKKDDSNTYEYDTFNILSVEYALFFKEFKYLCVDAYDSPIMLAVAIQYPSIIINNKLYLGDYGDASSREVMNHLNITHIVNVSKLDNAFDKDDRFNYLQYIHFPIEDEPTTQIHKIFIKCIDFIDKALNENNGNNNSKILVHCAAGISRSTTIVIAYFMKCKNFSYNDALEYVRERREVVYPNEGFQKQLQLWAENNFK